MGSRARRWILGSLLALGVTAVAAVVGLQLLLRFDARPRDVEERLLPGPDGLLLRSLSYTDPGTWVDRERRVHEYALVDPRDGSEQPIGERPEPLGEDALRLAEGHAEIVVGDLTFRRTRHGWVRFAATGGAFLYRH